MWKYGELISGKNYKRSDVFPFYQYTKIKTDAFLKDTIQSSMSYGA